MGFTPEMVASGHWIKRNEWVTRELICHPDGTLTEWDPADPEQSWSGRWQIQGHALHFIVRDFHMEIGSGDGPTYQAAETTPASMARAKGATWTRFTVDHFVAPGLPFEPVSPRFPGRGDLPINGPRHFVKAVTAILDELEAKAPNRYRESVEYLPEARWDESITNRANSSGHFKINVDDPHFPHTFLHEVGHNVAGHTTTRAGLDKNAKEREAFEYEDLVITELGRQPRRHSS